MNILTCWTRYEHFHLIFNACFLKKSGLYWWRMLETKCVGDNHKMLVTVLTILVAKIHYLSTLVSDTNIQSRHKLSVTNITVSPRSLSPKSVFSIKKSYFTSIFVPIFEINLRNKFFKYRPLETFECQKMILYPKSNNFHKICFW